MEMSGFLDIAIGLVFMYLVLSLICTTVNELIATFLKLRAKQLSKTVAALIDNEDLRRAFYNHGLISNAQVASRRAKPETAPAPTDAVGSPVKGAQADAVGRPRDKDHPSYLDSRSVALALLDSLNPAHQADPAAQAGFPAIEEIRAAIKNLPDSNIRDVLLTSLATAGDDIGKLRDELAGWFDTAMDRLSGGYKREIKRISLGVAMFLALALNADSLRVGEALWEDQTLRDQIVNAAGEIVKTPTTSAGPPAALQCNDPDPDKAANCLLTRLSAQEQQLRPFPIGWKASAFPESDVGAGGWIFWTFLKILGLIWTGLALSLGAPFWFDLLQKFMNVRGAGVKPERVVTT